MQRVLVGSTLGCGGPNPFELPMIPTAKTQWRREHSDGSHGIVEQHASGIFIGADLVAINDGLRTGAPGEYVEREQAMRATDAAADRRGHHCDCSCTSWQPEAA